MTWNNLRWGIEFYGADGKPIMIGSLWLNQTPHPYPGEPQRALLFMTRKQARDFCAERHAIFAGWPYGCKQWRLKPVRVRETVRKV